jgi:DNA processing protein
MLFTSRAVEIESLGGQSLKYWLGFNRAKGIGPIRLRALIQHFGDIETAWNAAPGALQAAGVDQRALASLISTRASCNLDDELRAVERAGARVITIEDAEYPDLLKTIYDPPPVLYIKGMLTEADSRAIAIVGTRRASSYGKMMAREIVEPLARQGITIVSGLARGIDAVAHEAAVDAGGRTIAVMATGIDQIYPREHQRLAEAIAEHGALLSELPLGSRPESRHFAPRNRIVSGLSLGTVVVEAAEHSGALLTANQALEQGREVFAVPGNVLSPVSRGTNSLIQAGARMATSADDILSELRLDRAAPSTGARVHTAPIRIEMVSIVENELDDTELTIMRLLSAEPQNIDDLAHQCGLPVRKVSSTLTILETKGLIAQVGIMQYALAHNLSARNF